MSLTTQHPDRPGRAFQMVSHLSFKCQTLDVSFSVHLEVSKALQVRKEAHTSLLLDSLQLQPTEIFGAVKHILSGTAGEEEVDEGLASVAVDWVD